MKITIEDIDYFMKSYERTSVASMGIGEGCFDDLYPENKKLQFVDLLDDFRLLIDESDEFKKYLREYLVLKYKVKGGRGDENQRRENK